MNVAVRQRVTLATIAHWIDRGYIEDMSVRIVATDTDTRTVEYIPAEDSDGPDGAVYERSRNPHAAVARSFKLRFAAPNEPGRSGLSAVRPLTLPAPVTDKFYARGAGAGAGAGEGAVDDAAMERALAQVRERFALGPREKYPHPVTTSHEYGWHHGCATRAAVASGASGAVGAMGARSPHHIRDSAWLRTRLRLLAPDAAYKRR